MIRSVISDGRAGAWLLCVIAAGCGGGDRVATLIAQLRETDGDLRIAAADELGEMGVEAGAAVPALVLSSARYDAALADFATHFAYTSRVITAARFATDWDSDGYSNILGHKDAAIMDPQIRPLAAEVPDNGTDEDGAFGDSSGADLDAARWPRSIWPSSFHSADRSRSRCSTPIWPATPISFAASTRRPAPPPRSFTPASCRFTRWARRMASTISPRNTSPDAIWES